MPHLFQRFHPAFVIIIVQGGRRRAIEGLAPFHSRLEHDAIGSAEQHCPIRRLLLADHDRVDAQRAPRVDVRARRVIDCYCLPKRYISIEKTREMQSVKSSSAQSNLLRRHGCIVVIVCNVCSRIFASRRSTPPILLRCRCSPSRHQSHDPRANRRELWDHTLARIYRRSRYMLLNSIILACAPIANGRARFGTCRI
jgi:hypothetical protein